MTKDDTFCKTVSLNKKKPFEKPISKTSTNTSRLIVKYQFYSSTVKMIKNILHSISVTVNIKDVTRQVSPVSVI